MTRASLGSEHDETGEEQARIPLFDGVDGAELIGVELAATFGKEKLF